MYEIADQVGYKNVDYFHKKFKKYVGESPAEFRKGHGLEPESGKYPPPHKNLPLNNHPCNQKLPHGFLHAAVLISNAISRNRLKRFTKDD